MVAISNAEQSPGIGWLVAAASFGCVLVQLDVTIINVALPRIGTDLHAEVSGLQWIVDAYALVFASCLLTAGFFSDRIGARRVYLAGLGFFAIASLACGLATNALALQIGRAFQGIGAAAILPSSLALINHASGHQPRLRAWAVGWWTAAGSIAIASGPVLGGLILGFSSWRMIFLVNVPICLVGALLTFALPETFEKTGARGFDFNGQILAILFLAGLTGAIIEAKPLGLMHPLVLGGFFIGLAAFMAFITVERKALAPMLPLKLFRVPGVAACIFYGMAINCTYYGIVFVLILYLQHGLGYGPIATGFAYLPLTATLIGVNLVSSRLVGQFGSRQPMIWGALIDAAGFVLLLRLDLTSSFWMMLPAFLLLPIGMGLGVPAMTTAILTGVPKEFSGVGAGVLNAARQAAGAVGVALFGALANGDALHIAHGLHVSSVIAAGLLLAAALTAFIVPKLA